jgi:Xaa-Pro aminopeptidase
MKPGDIEAYRYVQQIAKDAMLRLATDDIIKEGASEYDIAEAANKYMTKNGSGPFWYHGVGSLVLVGDRTTMSVSGREYEPSPDQVVGNEDLVTVDLGPCVDRNWGDYARSFVVEGGKVKTDEVPGSDRIQELHAGVSFAKEVHEKFIEYAHPNMTFGQLHNYIMVLLRRLGWRNLDFHGNLGHTIEKHIDRRRYIVGDGEDSRIELRKAGLFTFEPHMSLENGDYGFKWENIYFFSGRELQCL